MEMVALTPNGDTKYTWEADEMDQAQAIFDEYTGNGFSAFRMSDEGQGKVLSEFDPEAGTILFVPLMQGG